MAEKKRKKKKYVCFCTFQRISFLLILFIETTKRLIMMKKMLIPLVGLAMGFALFAACSNDSDSANSLVSGSTNSTVAKIESASFTTENQSNCGMNAGLAKTEAKTDSVHLYMNEDGSAVLKEKMQSICSYKGEISNISLEKLNDTLQVSIDYYEYPPDTFVVYNDPLGKNDTLIMSRYPTPKCGGICSADYEINVPAEFVDSKFVSVNRSGNAKVYPIAYVKEE
jgi:hypothetical protein